MRTRRARQVRGYGMGYRGMCRFFSGAGLFAHAAVAPYELVWRLDSDSFLLGPPTADPFAQLLAANASYAWVHAYRDEPVFVAGLWETTAAFLRAEGIGQSHSTHARCPDSGCVQCAVHHRGRCPVRATGIDEARVHAWVPGGEEATWEATPMCFATNCFVARREWFLSAPYTRYFRALDAAGGFYIHRWGDACVHMLAAAALLPPSATLRLRSLAYWHQGTVILPAALRGPARALLADLPSPLFAEAAPQDARAIARDLGPPDWREGL